jgi:hypothetical protein
MLLESLVKADERISVEETRNRYGILIRKLHENGSVTLAYNDYQVYFLGVKAAGS